MQLVRSAEPGLPQRRCGVDAWLWACHQSHPPCCAVLACHRARARYLESKGYNFYANEYTLRASAPGGAPTLCSQFLNVILVRQPAERLLSHMRFIVKVYQDKLEVGQGHAGFLRAWGLLIAARGQQRNTHVGLDPVHDDGEKHSAAL